MKKYIYIIILIILLTIPMTANAASLPAPSYVSAFVYSTGNIQVTWDNTVSGASGYTVQRKTNSGGFITLANLSTSVSAYNDRNISNGHTYIYRVYATSGSVTGDATESIGVEYLYPSNLTVTSVSDSETELIWSYPNNNNIPGENYQTVIERRLEGSSTWQTVSTVPGDRGSYTDINLTEATRYYYRIRAVTATSAAYLYYPNSSNGQYISTLMKAPQQVTAEVVSTASIKISWRDASSKETGYMVERKTRYGGYVRIGSVEADITSYTDKTPVNGEQYTYRVTATSSLNRGAPSEEVTVPLLFPVSFKIEDAYSTQLTLTWDYPGEAYIPADNTCVLIERRESEALLWEEIYTTRPGETEYTDSDLTPGTRYYYRIRSRYDNDFTTGYLPSSSGTSAYTLLLFDTHFYGYALSDREISLKWDKEAAGSHSIILEKLDSSGVYETLSTMSRTGSYIDTVSPGSRNSYRLKLHSASIDSDYTAEVDIIAEALPAARALAVKSILQDRIYITWEYDKVLETGFEVWRHSDSEIAWQHIGVTDPGQCTFSDENIQNGETYTYQIRAIKNERIFSPFVSTEPVNVSFTEPDGILVAGFFDGRLHLGWEDFSDMEDYYAIEYKTSINDDWHVWIGIPDNITLFKIDPDPGLDYTFRIRAISNNPIYESISNEVFFSSKMPVVPKLSSPLIVGSNRVALNWLDMSDNEEAFEIYRKNRPSGEFYSIGTVGKDVTAFIDDTVLPNQTYTYVVRSKTASLQSYNSNEIVVETLGRVEFTDIDSYAWAKDAIHTLASRGIIVGDGKGHYNPSGNMTRAEFIKLLVTAFLLPENSVGSFKDVRPAAWYHKWIITAYKNNIVDADEDGLFHPDTPILRQDIVYYSSRAINAAGLELEQPPLNILYKFKDYDQISPYAQSAFAAMNQAGVINGISADRLAPLNTATRAEAATILYRMLQILEAE